MSNPFAAGKKALAICDRCGLSYKFNDLRKETVNRNLTNLKVCPECLDIDHEQLQLGRLDPTDPIALREPRPDRADGTSPNDRYLTSISSNFNNSLDGWSKTGSNNTLTTNNSYVTLTATGTLSIQGIQKNTLSIDTSVYTKARAMVRIVTFGTPRLGDPFRGYIYWNRTTDGTSFTTLRRVISPNPYIGLYPTDRWFLMEWDLEGVADWDGTVSGARVDITADPGSQWDCEYIRFESV